MLAILCVLASHTTVLQGAQLERRYVGPVTAAASSSTSNPGECPSETAREELRATIHREVRMHLQNITQNTSQGKVMTCIVLNIAIIPACKK